MLRTPMRKVHNMQENRSKVRKEMKILKIKKMLQIKNCNKWRMPLMGWHEEQEKWIRNIRNILLLLGAHTIHEVGQHYVAVDLD